ncbi:FMN-binding protein [Eubacterium multiforme]|uniref:Uncharacterized protein with FMN-binding domain n=1 Tax=Eubacterium multiforme TaxID=83339 RepID=A0ABT9UTF2_9FIRM|nr:FMN-binding protein [Eubacterium multiforme]MDQ0149564.1 uncharacterized protein with FMN-binding domain [Eubacterium multiforme]
MNKKIGLLILTCILSVSVVGCNKNNDEKDTSNSKGNIEKKYKDGKYEGTGEGYEGKTKVSVKVDGGKIKNIEVIKTSDDESYIKEAKKLIPKIVETQNIEVESVSGATMSSKGIKSAIKDALKDAK